MQAKIPSPKAILNGFLHITEQKLISYKIKKNIISSMEQEGM